MLVLVNLYKCYARPVLVSVIFSHHVYLINLIENAQKNLPKIAKKYYQISSLDWYFVNLYFCRIRYGKTLA